MSTRKTAVLALILALSVLYLVKVVMPGRDRVAGERAMFAKLATADITRIDITRADQPDKKGERFTLDHSADWSLVGVRGAVLDKGAIDGMIAGLNALDLGEQLQDRDLGGDLSVYGVDKPDFTIVVSEKSGQQTEVAFGKRSEYLSARYLKVSGRPGVYMTPEQSFQAVAKSSADLRSKTPFNFNSQDARELELITALGRINLTQPKVGEWKIVSPGEFPASLEDVNSLMGAIQQISVAEFIDDPSLTAQSLGLSKPRATVRVELREGAIPAKINLDLWAAQSQGEGKPQTIYITSSETDTVFKLARDPSDLIVKDLTDLRDKDLVKLPVSSIASVVSGGSADTPVTIAVDGLSWKVNGKESDPVFVEQLLKDISALKAVDFPESVPADVFNEPFLTLAITKNDPEKSVLNLTIGREIDPKATDLTRYAKLSNTQTIFAIRDVEAKRVTPHEEALVAKPTPVPTAATTATAVAATP
jgi:hypothetical protein